MPEQHETELEGEIEEMFGPDPFNIDNLHPELQRYVEDTPTLGQVLKHPLVFQVPGPILVNHANAIYEQKVKAVKEARREKDFKTVIWLHERPYRMELLKAFVEAGKISVEQLREELPGFWLDTEIPEGQQEDPLELFRLAGFVTDDLSGFEALPDPLTLWRGVDGVCELTPSGPSWTLEKSVAVFFAVRYENGWLYKIEIPKEAAKAYITGRGEAEIILDFDDPEWESYRNRIEAVKDFSVKRGKRRQVADAIGHQGDSK